MGAREKSSQIELLYQLKFLIDHARAVPADASQSIRRLRILIEDHPIQMASLRVQHNLGKSRQAWLMEALAMEKRTPLTPNPDLEKELGAPAVKATVEPHVYNIVHVFIDNETDEWIARCRDHGVVAMKANQDDAELGAARHLARIHASRP